MSKKKIFLGILALLVIIQFIRIDKTNPPAPPEKDFLTIETPPAQIATTLKNTCYDCHAHTTKYPWYTNVAPFSWLIKGHIKGGRQHLNFSTWSDYDAGKRAHKMEEIAEEVDEKHMPMKSYTWMHPEAKMSDADRQALVDWAKSKAK